MCCVMLSVPCMPQAKKDSPNFSEFFVGTRWAQPSLKHLKQLMRYVFENREEARAKGAAARLYLEENFSPEAVARGLKKLILAAEGRAKDKMMKRLPDTDSKMRSRWSPQNQIILWMPHMVFDLNSTFGRTLTDLGSWTISMQWALVSNNAAGGKVIWDMWEILINWPDKSGQ